MATKTATVANKLGSVTVEMDIKEKIVIRWFKK